jgi:EAL domain-containing protein (putative c-di-GMP-specific phosphodiesterase class I)
MPEKPPTELPRPCGATTAAVEAPGPLPEVQPLPGGPTPAVPGWARAQEVPERPGWWSAARQWWQRLGGKPPGESASESASACGRPEPVDAIPAAWADAAQPTSPLPLPEGPGDPEARSAPLLERLRRSVAHALRHPGYGFAVLVLVLRPPADTPVRAGLRRQVEHRLQLVLRPGDALEMSPALHDAAAVATGTAKATAAGPRTVDEALADDEAAFTADSLPGLPPESPAGADGAQPSIRVALVLDGLLTAEDLVAVVERVRREMAEPFLSGRTALRLRMALAAVHAVPGAPPQPAESLLARADTLLAALGAEGVAGLDARPLSRPGPPAAPRGPGPRELERALDAGELQLEYQPVVALDTGAVLALDLVWRWQHRQQGRLPAEAVTQALLGAEGHGDTVLADRLLQQALRTAAADGAPLAREFGAAAPSRIALVLTPAQLARADTADRLAEALGLAALQPAQLQLILPSLPDPADRNPFERLRMLAAQGYALALEGVGDSRRSPTLATLAAAPLALWRLPPGLLAGPVAGSEHRQVLLDGILSYARDLGVATLATGLDTPELLAQARRRGCLQGQGATVAAPMAAAALPRWLARQIAQPA